MPTGQPSTIASRDARGRIVSSKGRALGCKEKPETAVKKAAGKIARRMLSDQLQMDHEQLRKMVPGARNALEMHISTKLTTDGEIVPGNLAAALWLLNKTHVDAKEAPIPEGVLPEISMSNMEGVLAAGQHAMEAIAAGSLPIAQGERYLAMLTTYAKLRMVDEMEKLEQLLKSIEERGRTPITDPKQVLPQDQLPAWGKLRNTSDADIDDASLPPAGVEKT